MGKADALACWALQQVVRAFACAACTLVGISLLHATAALAHELAEAYHGSFDYFTIVNMGADEPVVTSGSYLV